ncbi:mitogen-activated protein kinase kinase kinase 1 isoform X1 [Coffea arabica]|uniref:mitogen-activated protein kinase kinase kinase n=1 Tax=Coffea arabica TaxID=13443 RepID=A0A6P6UMS5_COFAR
MHRLPNIFITRKKSGSRMGSRDSPAAKPKPRLERRNALKNIDYELPSTSSEENSSVSSASSSSAAAAAATATRTRSLDLIHPLSEKTSFRIEGNGEGEYEVIFRSLGLSGPEDFAIPTDAWEAMKVRSSSDVLPRFSRLNYSSVSSPGAGDTDGEVCAASPRVSDVISPRNEGIDFGCLSSSVASSGVSLTNPQILGIDFGCSNSSSAISCGDQIIEKIDCGLPGNVPIDVNGGSVGAAPDVVCELLYRLGDSVRITDAISSRIDEQVKLNHVRDGDGNLNGNEGVEIIGRGGGGGGIKGVRPPALAPPPAMSLPVIDNGCSTWDILRSFAPEDDRVPFRFEVSDAVTSDDEGGKGYLEEEEEEVRDVVVRRTITGENGMLSGSCSFTTTSIDDDSSSTTTEPLSNISPNGRFRRIITYWEKGDLLGRGSFGSVYEGIADDGFFFAVKEVSLLDQGEEGRQSIYQLEQEIALLSQFEHENIVQYYGTDKDDSKLYIFLELVTKGSLLSLYQKYNLRDSQVSAYTRQILHGLKYLHDRNVVHRDIKCANILVDANGSVKLADFGLAKATKLNDVKSCKGTAFWMAPEVVNRKTQGYGLAADIWSLGCTVLEMLTRKYPYSRWEPMAALFRIGRGEPPDIPETLSGDAREFILKCLQVNPIARPSAAQLLDHPFVKRALPSSCLASPYHPSRRV